VILDKKIESPSKLMVGAFRCAPDAAVGTSAIIQERVHNSIEGKFIAVLFHPWT
jgi:hypothetical protein